MAAPRKKVVKAEAETVSPATLRRAPAGYGEWLADVKTRIHTAQQRAALAVNHELVHLYWQLGQDILARQAEQGWGTKVIDRIAADLRGAFPDMKGFSPRNLKYMRAFAEAWPDAEFVQGVLALLPWYHHLALLDKLDGEDARRWYAAKARIFSKLLSVLLLFGSHGSLQMRVNESGGTSVASRHLRRELDITSG